MGLFRTGRSLAVGAGFLGVFAGSSTAGAQSAIERFALRIEAGGGAMLSPYQRNSNPLDTSFYDNALGYNLALQGTGRLAFTLEDPFVLQVSVANWVFPSSLTSNPGYVFMPTLGLRIEPTIGPGRLFADFNAGPAFTGTLVRFGFDVGLGYEFNLTRAIGLGPVVRYGQVVEPDTINNVPNLFPDDARYITLGLSLSLRVPHNEPEPPPPVVLRDTDGDGVMDPDDYCPTIPQGDHPDIHRRGCPTPDSDGDGVLDDTDQCVDTPAGPHPDPDRPGCPDGDRDADGVLDHQDQCPDVAQGPHPDPSRPGCPDGDRDHDGIPDHADHCPDPPETYNGLQDEDGCPDVAPHPTVVVENNVIRVLGDPINFATASDRIIGRHSFDVLEAISTILRVNEAITRLDIQGHTDNRGTHEYNEQLSTRRAEAVKAYLVEHGAAAGRLETHGYGPDRPERTNATGAGRAANRRVEFHILGLNGAAVPTGSSPTATVLSASEHPAAEHPPAAHAHPAHPHPATP